MWLGYCYVAAAQVANTLCRHNFLGPTFEGITGVRRIFRTCVNFCLYCDKQYDTLFVRHLHSHASFHTINPVLFQRGANGWFSGPLIPRSSPGHLLPSILVSQFRHDSQVALTELLSMRGDQRSKPKQMSTLIRLWCVLRGSEMAKLRNCKLYWHRCFNRTQHNLIGVWRCWEHGNYVNKIWDYCTEYSCGS